MWRFLIAILLVGVIEVSSIVDVRSEEWTSLRGTSSVDAKLIGVWNNRALLRLNSGKQISVSLDDLRADSRIQAQDLQLALEANIRQRVADLSAIAEEAAAPLPADWVPVASAPEYVLPPSGAPLSDSLEQVRAAALAGHLRVYFDTLPPSHQTKWSQLYSIAIRKIDPTSWESARSVARDWSNLVVSRQRWWFSHPRFSALESEQAATMIRLAQWVHEVTSDEVTSLANLQSRSLEEVLATLDEATAALLHQLFQTSPMLASLLFPDAQVESGPNGRMTVRSVLPFVGTPVGQGMVMTEVEGRWVEGANAEDAAKVLDTYGQTLEKIPDRSFGMPAALAAVVQAMATVTPSLEAARSPAEFHQAIDAAIVELAPLINTWAGFRPANRQYNYDYDDGSGYDDAMDEYDSRGDQ